MPIDMDIDIDSDISRTDRASITSSKLEEKKDERLVKFLRLYGDVFDMAYLSSRNF
jgi:hypothetical protein